MQARYVIYALLSMAYGVNIMQRNAINFLIPLMATDLRLPIEASGMLLGCFFPTYVLTQIPGAFIINLIGEKLLTSVNLFANSALLLGLPAAARAGPRALAVAFAAMGAFQGPIVPAVAGCQVWWMPLGAERAWATRVLSFGSVFFQIGASVLTPWLGNRLGWRRVCALFGTASLGVAAVWQLLAVSRPAQWRLWKLSAEEAALLEAARPDRDEAGTKGEGGKAEPTEAKLALRELFSVRAARDVCLAQVAGNTFTYTFQVLGPTYFSEALGASPAEAGRLLALPPLVTQVGNIATGIAEAILLPRIGVLSVRRLTSGIAFLGAAASLLAFSATTSKRVATLLVCLGYGLMTGHTAGFDQSYIEVGGGDVGMLSAVGNSLANTSGFFLPALMVSFRRRFNSWAPVFIFSAAVQLLSMSVYLSSATTRSARAILADAKRQAA